MILLLAQATADRTALLFILINVIVIVLPNVSASENTIDLRWRVHDAFPFAERTRFKTLEAFDSLLTENALIQTHEFLRENATELGLAESHRASAGVHASKRWVHVPELHRCVLGDAGYAEEVGVWTLNHPRLKSKDIRQLFSLVEMAKSLTNEYSEKQH